MSTDLTGYLYLRIIRCSSQGRVLRGRENENSPNKDSMNIWPFSKLRKLENSLQKEREFSKMVIEYLDSKTGDRNTRVFNSLIIFGKDSTYLLTKEPSGWVT
jgi:hypothetical protein